MSDRSGSDGSPEHSARPDVEHIPKPPARPFLFIAVFFAAWIVWLLASSAIIPAKTEFIRHLAAGDAARLIIWCVLPASWLAIIERRAIGSALHPVDRRSSWWAALAALALSVVLLLGLRLTRGHWSLIPGGRSAAEYWWVTISIMLLAIGEEFTFRGVLLSGLARRGWAFWAANLVVAALFALSHWPGWLLFGGIPAIALITATLRVFVFGMLMGGLVRIEGGLIAAIVVHALNDLIAGTFF